MERTCLITGAANGIGYEFAKIFLSKSYDVFLIDKDIDKLKKTKNQFEKYFNRKVYILESDLTERDIADKIHRFVHKQKIKIDVLINNAGYGIFGFFDELDWSKQLDLIRISVVTSTHLTKLFLLDMIKRNYGRIINVSSVAAFQPGPLMSVYYSSKAFILSFSQAIANELKNKNITVTVLCPGMTKTNFQKSTGNINANFGLLCTSAKRVAEYGYWAMEKKKVVAIPCFYNRIIANIHRFTTLNQAVWLSRFLQEKNRKRIKNE